MPSASSCTASFAIFLSGRHMYSCICICIYIHVCMYIYTQTHIYIYMCIYRHRSIDSYRQSARQEHDAAVRGRAAGAEGGAQTSRTDAGMLHCIYCKFLFIFGLRVWQHICIYIHIYI